MTAREHHRIEIIVKVIQSDIVCSPRVQGAGPGHQKSAGSTVVNSAGGSCHAQRSKNKAETCSCEVHLSTSRYVQAVNHYLSKVNRILIIEHHVVPAVNYHGI